MPKVSVIIPVYNVEKYLRECLDSVINQTLKDIEIICVDDGSTDKSPDILQEYQNKDKRIKVFSQKNLSQGYARNRAIKIAKGDYICFVDSDDWIDEQALENSYEYAVKNNAEVVQFNYKTFYEEKNEYKNSNFAQQIEQKYGLNLVNKTFYSYKDVVINDFHSFDMHVVNKLYLRKFIENNNIHFSNKRYGEDWLFAVSTLFSAKKIYYLNLYNYYYRYRHNSSSHSSHKYLSDIFSILKDVKKLLIEKKLYDDYKKQYDAFVLNQLSFTANLIPKNKKFIFYICIIFFCSFNTYKNFLHLKNKYNNNSHKIFNVLGIKIKIRRKNAKG